MSDNEPIRSAVSGAAAANQDALGQPTPQTSAAVTPQASTDSSDSVSILPLENVQWVPSRIRTRFGLSRTIYDYVGREWHIAEPMDHFPPAYEIALGMEPGQDLSPPPAYDDLFPGWLEEDENQDEDEDEEEGEQNGRTAGERELVTLLGHLPFFGEEGPFFEGVPIVLNPRDPRTFMRRVGDRRVCPRGDMLLSD